MTSISKWRIFCNDENSWVYGWVDNNSPLPSKCFNNTSHTVNLNSSNIVDFISSNEVSIVEETIKTQGHFRTEGFKFVIPPNTTYNYQHTLPYSINLLAIWFSIKPENIDDVFNAYYQPPIYGTITTNILSPSNTLNIDNTFINIVKIGFIIILERLSDNYKENLGEILSINKINNTITLTNSTSQNFFINDKVIINVNGVKNTILGTIGRHSIGSSKLGASYIHSSGLLTASYENKSLTDEKSFIYELEYLY